MFHQLCFQVLSQNHLFILAKSRFSKACINNASLTLLDEASFL